MHKKSSYTKNPYKKIPNTNNLYKKPLHKNLCILTIRMKNHYTNIMRINIFLVVN